MKHAIITFDVDGSWVIEKTFGIEIKEIPDKDPAIQEGIKKALSILKEHNINGTFFVVGKNLEKFPKEHELIYDRGHEIGSHSYSHTYPFYKLSYQKKLEEITKNTKLLTKFFGKPKGFRCPGYSIDKDTFNILEKEKYIYDSSVVSTYIPGHLKFKNLFAPKEPYFIGKDYLKRGNRKLIEMPPSCYSIFPLLGTALHNLGLDYFKIISKQILKQKRPIILNFHTRDLTKTENKAIYLRGVKKRERILKGVLTHLKGKVKFITMENYCKNEF